jgi:hypothetical protein
MSSLDRHEARLPQEGPAIRPPPLLPTLSTMVLALACAALMVIADAALADAPAPNAACFVPL